MLWFASSARRPRNVSTGARGSSAARSNAFLSRRPEGEARPATARLETDLLDRYRDAAERVRIEGRADSDVSWIATAGDQHCPMLGLLARIKVLRLK